MLESDRVGPSSHKETPGLVISYGDSAIICVEYMALICARRMGRLGEGGPWEVEVVRGEGGVAMHKGTLRSGQGPLLKSEQSFHLRSSKIGYLHSRSPTHRTKTVSSTAQEPTYT